MTRTATPRPRKPRKGRKPKTTITRRQRETAEEGPVDPHWRTYFLQELAATSCVTRAAEAAGVSTSRAYKARRNEADFADRWSKALAEGYEHLELELLAFLRGTDGKERTKLDVANAIRLLSAHRQTVAEVRARADDEDEEAVFASITAKIEAFRMQRIARVPMLPEPAQGQADGA
jgi:hypothetical protein